MLVSTTRLATAWSISVLVSKAIARNNLHPEYINQLRRVQLIRCAQGTVY